MEKFPPIDTTYFYTYECVEPYNTFFYRTIEEIKMTSTSIYCLLRYGLKSDQDVVKDEYTFVTINRKSGTVEEFSIPCESGMTLLGMGLRMICRRKSNPSSFLRKSSLRCKGIWFIGG